MVLLIAAALFFTAGCAQNFSPEITVPPALPQSLNIGQSFLNGSFIAENGERKELADFQDKPLLLFFVGEFCGACRQEAVHLKTLFAQKGLPTELHVFSVMLEVDPGTATQWFQSISPAGPSWTLGSDPDLQLFFDYFAVQITPSVLYFNPQTQILKRWQKSLTLNELEKETGPWYAL